MNNLKVSTRLIMLIGVMSMLLLAIGGMGLFGMKKTNDALMSVYQDRTVPAAQLGEIRALVLHNRLSLNIAQVTPTPEIIKERTAQIEANIAEINKTWDAYMATSLTPEERQLAEAFTDSRKKFVQEGLLPTVAALRANNIQEAQRLTAEKIRPLSVPLEAGNDALIKLQIDVARKEYDAAEARYETIHLASLMVIAAGLLFAGVFGFVLVRSLSRQLGGEPGVAASLAQSVAAGDLSVVIDLKQGDKTSLMAQLKTMQTSLMTVVSNVRQNSESVAIASAQIAQGNNDLSGRTEEQASALEETAASMEQLSSTVKQNADNAKQANQLAQGASSVAIKGGEVVGRVVDTMKDINNSSQKIADIISVIDGIAFQTNILALNAAVEAARAGEQGRGFAVVASEVRSLAQRSSTAAREIKTLIGDSTEKVTAGSRLVDDAGRTMQEILDSVNQVARLIDGIAEAGESQSSGIGQVHDAIAQLDTMTQQNAALVEQLAASAQSLKGQSGRLSESMGSFRVQS